SVEVAETVLQLAWWGSLVTVLLGAVLAVLLPADRVRRLATAVAARLARIPPRPWAVAVGALGFGLGVLVALVLYGGYFTNVDEIASTLHARYLASGRLGGPTFSMPEFWLIPNTLVVAEGWVSQYPPTHLFALAAVAVLGIPVLLGPLAFGLMVGLIAASLVRLLPESPGLARVAGLAVVVSPLLFFLGGGSMNHVTAGTLLAATLYASLRARDGTAWWSVAAGVAVGLAVAGRPLVGLVLGSVLTLGVWVPRALRSTARGLPWLLPRLVGTGLGGAPIALALGWYNARLFGSPSSLGYLVAFGGRHRLGFHDDPWGSSYGPADALAFTSTDVLSAGVQLLETPFPATALIGLALLLGARLSGAMGLLVAWAFLPVAANAYYWFHDVRMLFEAAPAWVVLFVLAAAQLGRKEPAAQARAARLASLARDVCVWAVVVGIAGAGWNVWTRWESYAWEEETLERIVAPSPPEAPAIVFVHVSWNERLSSILQGAAGMRQDTVINVLRRNTNCALHEYALARTARVRDGLNVPLPEIDLEQLPGSPTDIVRPPSATGATVRIRQGERFTQSCLRELNADRFGAVALAPLLWQGDLPGIEEGRPLFVRDLGPERNQRLLDVYPERVAFGFTPVVVEGPPQLLPYGDAMELLWGAVTSSP
ncbi:MAG TPA: hypothetical protein VMM35_02295, partial [Longimicrobiales bacterium]|nr:hypothetical protein [Longimicrobiales bacterium]